MEAPLASFCLACAKFTTGDRVGELLAVAAAAPYLVIYHIAVLLHARRELHIGFVFLGSLVTNALSSAIKKVLRQPRPAATCSLLGNCHKHGMPSSHSAVMAYALVTCLLLYLHRCRSQGRRGTKNRAGKTGAVAAAAAGAAAPAHQQHQQQACVARLDRLAPAVQLLEVLLLAALSAAVWYGRIYLGYHTPGQVVAGIALGAGFAAAWWRLTLAVCQRWGAPLLRLFPLRALHFRSTLGWPDVHAVEAAPFASPTKGQHAS